MRCKAQNAQNLLEKHIDLHRLAESLFLNFR